MLLEAGADATRKTTGSQLSFVLLCAIKTRLRWIFYWNVKADVNDDEKKFGGELDRMDNSECKAKNYGPNILVSNALGEIITMVELYYPLCWK